MRFLSSILLASLLLFSSADGFAAKRLSNRGFSYLPTFGVGSTGSVSYTATAGATSYLPAGDGSATALVRIFTSTAAYLAVGANPTATTAGIPIAANTEMILEVPSNHKISAVQLSAPGNLYVTHLVMYPGE